MVADTESPSRTGPVATIIERLQRVKAIPGGYLASCPVPSHGKGKGDRHPSLSISEGDDGRALVSCHAGCTIHDVLSAIGLKPADLFPDTGNASGRIDMRKRRTTEPRPQPEPQPDTDTSTDDDGGIPPNPTTTHQHSGLTLENYAESKGFSVDVLRGNGMSTLQHPSYGTCVRIPYLDEKGQEVATRYRLSMTGDPFRWKAGTKAKGLLYGAHRLDSYRAGTYAVIVEGESDCHAAWHHDVPAVGIPGAAQWDEANAAHFDGFERVYIVIEPDKGGDAVKAWVAESAIRDRVYLVSLEPYKDLSELHASGNDFDAAWTQAMADAVPWTDTQQEDERAARYDAWEQCATLATLPNILDAAADALEAAGVVGERRNLKLVYLIITSRFLPRPVNASIKGASSSGKSYQLERVLDLVPPDAFYALSGMSERALIYDDEPLQHRYIVIYEAAGLSGELASYFIRSLLSEGAVRYVTVESTPDGMKPRHIERDGPTGLLTTTTLVHLHPENETRMLSIPTKDTAEQTARVMASLATEHEPVADLDAWHALQEWLALACHDVTIPYAPVLAAKVPAVAVRLRRDFGLLLSLIRASAILHQATRERDDAGRIVATLDDYANVHELAADLLSEGLDVTVPESTRETVAAVAELVKGDAKPLQQRVLGASEPRSASVTQVAERLSIDKGAASRRVAVATRRGFLKNLEDKKGKPARLVLGDALPDDRAIFPDPDTLRQHVEYGPAMGSV